MTDQVIGEVEVEPVTPYVESAVISITYTLPALIVTLSVQVWASVHATERTVIEFVFDPLVSPGLPHYKF